MRSRCRHPTRAGDRWSICSGRAGPGQWRRELKGTTRLQELRRCGQRMEWAHPAPVPARVPVLWGWERKTWALDTRIQKEPACQPVSRRVKVESIYQQVQDRMRRVGPVVRARGDGYALCSSAGKTEPKIITRTFVPETRPGLHDFHSSVDRAVGTTSFPCLDKTSGPRAPGAAVMAP